MHMDRRIAFLGFLFLFCSVFAQDAYAYLDPGTGSYILQLLIAVLVGALFAVKLFWNNIKYFFKRLFSGKGKNE